MQLLGGARRHLVAGPGHALVSCSGGVALARGALLDALLAAGAVHDALHEDARREDVVGVELAGLDELLDLGDGQLAAVAIIGLKLRAVLR